MSNVFDGFSLPNPAMPALAFTQGLEHGRQQREEREVRAALGAYAVNPDDPAAFTALAQTRPELAIQIRDQQAKRQQQAQVTELQQRAAAGDRTALAQLAGVDVDAYDKLADNQRQDVHTRVETIGNAALDVAQRPPAERPAAWDAYIDQLSQQYPELAPLKGHYSEERLNAAIAQAGQMKEHLDALAPQEFNIGPGEGRYQRDPVTGRVTTIVEPNLTGAPAFSPAPETRVVGGKTYYKVGGQWFDHPSDLGGGAGNGTGHFQR